MSAPRSSSPLAAAALATLAAACGQGGHGGPAGPPAGSAAGSGAGAAPPAPAALPTLGLRAVRDANFPYGEGAAAYARALAASRAAPRDWAAVRAGCEAALAKDPQHLDAHRLLATALATGGDLDGAAAHLEVALAGDWLAYAPTLATDPDLAPLRATERGKALAARSARLGEAFAREAAGGLWLLGRRAPWRPPAKPGVQPATSRGELYAYDRDSGRYLRLTHTDHQVAAFVRAPSGGEVAVLGFDRVALPTPAPVTGPAGADAGDAPLLARAFVLAVDAATWAPTGPRAAVPSAREVSIGYGAGDQLLVTTAPAAGRWALGPPATFAVDRATGKLTRTEARAPTPRVSLTVEGGRAFAELAAIEAAWTGDPPTASTLGTRGGAAIAVPESGAASQASVALAPDGAHLAFTTAADPCAPDAAPSLYVADARAGTLRHVLTARAWFATRWLDARTLAYEDDAGAIRLWDAGTGREVVRLADRGGLALAALATVPAPPCVRGAAPEGADGTGAAGTAPPDEPPPDEEPAGPVVSPTGPPTAAPAPPAP